MLKTLKVIFLALSLPKLALAIPTISQPITNSFHLSQTSKVSSHDIRDAKHLEDFYWAFRNQNYTWLSKSYKSYKPKSKVLSIYRPVLSAGKKIAYSISKNQPLICNSIGIGFDSLSRKYYSLFKKICFQEKISNLLNSQKPLSLKEKNFLVAHDYILTSNRYKNTLLKKINKSNHQDKVFFSNYVKQFIYTQRKLPLAPFMEVIQMDSKLTRYIQGNHLLDRYDTQYFTKEFKRLITDFRSHFLNGDQETASDLLQKAFDFYDNNESKISNAKAWKLFFYSGKKMAFKEEGQNLALSLFKFSEKVAEDDNLFASKFQSLITYYQSNQLIKAKIFIKESGFLDSFEKLTPQLRFWSAYIFDKTNEKVEAKNLYLKQITLAPLNYYSILSLKQLRNMNSNYTSDTLIKNDSFADINAMNISQVALAKIKLFRIFSKAQSSFLTSLQAKELRSTSPKSFFSYGHEQTISNLKHFLLTFYSQEQQFLISFKHAYSALKHGDLELTPSVISSLFPQIYNQIIKSQNSPIDHRLIQSLIRQESAFNRRAKSVVGARGLMQLMPATARMFKRRLKSHQLFDPNLNIKLGVKFLERLVKRYDGNLMFTLSAYNAGMGNVKKWMTRIPFGEDILLNVELIPFKETQKYVKLIYRNLFFYKYLDQDPDHLDLALSDSFNVTFTN